MKKRLLLSLLLLLFPLLALAQIITTEPQFPLVDQSVTVYFDATKGTAGLKDFTGDVYAHTGVVTNNSKNDSDWQHVVTTWPNNVPKIKTERIEPNLYKLKITPSVRDFYGVPAGETIKKMAFVFRTADGTKEAKASGGKDIFAKIYKSKFNVAFSQPADTLTFKKKNQSVSIEGYASSDDSNTTLTLKIDGQQVKQENDDTLRYTYSTSTAGNYTLTLSGTDGNHTSEISQHLVVNPAIDEQNRPQNLQDGITYVNSTTVRLSLFAPDKDYVYVIGDFNNWQPQPDYFMKKETVNSDSAYYWIQIDGLTPGKEYGFQYLVDGKLRLADPYSEKILDPDNDQYISVSTYPNLKPYPKGKTDHIVGVLQPGKQDYNWKHTNYDRPDKKNLVIYELLVRDFVKKHNFQTLTDTLDYIDRLGVNAIELMPIMEFDGNISWGYNPSFHLATDKYYGPADDLKAFIDEAHSRGIAVILDMVLNHAWGTSPLVRLWNQGDYGKPTAQNPYLNTNPRHDFNVGYDFNHESKATQYFVDRVNKHWLRDFHFDGLRFDLSKGFTQKNTLGDVSAWGQYDASRIAILERMADQIRTYDDSAYVILEHFAANSEEKELSNYGMMLWGNMHSSYKEASLGFNNGGKSNLSGIYYGNRGWSNPNLVGYMESHDEERIMADNLKYGNSSPNGDYDIKGLNTALNRIKLAAAFLFTVPGPKMFWQFGELGYDVSIEENGRTGEKPIRWNYLNEENRKKLYKTFKALIRLRNSNPAFTSENSQVTMDVDKALKKIKISSPQLEAMVIGNFDVASRQMTPSFSKSGKWYRYLRGDSVNISNTDTTLSLAPGEYRIYTDKHFKAPDEDIFESIPTQMSVHISKSFSGASSPQDFRMIALPGQSGKALDNVLKGKAGVDWQAFWDNGKDNDFMVKYDGSSTFITQPGRGFWVTNKKDFSYNETIPTVKLNDKNQASITLHKGWNIISNPLDINVSWNDVSAANGGNLQPIWEFDGSFSESSGFVSARLGEAFYFLNDQDLDQLKIPYSEKSAKKKAGPKKNEITLVTQVDRRETSSSTITFLNSHQNAPHKVIAPPSQFEGASLRFLSKSKNHQDSPRLNSLARIYRTPSTQGFQTSMTLSAKAGQTVVIRAKGFEKGALNKLVLLDKESGQKFSLTNGKKTTITPNKQKTSLVLLIGDTRYISQQQDKYLPKKIEITPNYPNPFNPSTVLKYSLPTQAKVRLQIYNVLGQRVKTLINDEVRTAGIHKVTFDASRQASGMYFAVFEIGKRRIVEKMMLIK